MILDTISIPPLTHAQILSVIYKQAKQSAQHSDVYPISLLSYPIEPIDLLGWLAAQEMTEKVYWKSRDGNYEVAGIGHVWIAQGRDRQPILRHVQQYLRHNDPRMRVFGATCFTPLTRNSTDTFGLPGTWFIAPRILISRNKNRYTIDIWHDNQEPVHMTHQYLASIHWENRSPTPLSSCTGVSHTMTYEMWADTVNDILNQIRAGRLSKVVPSRLSVYRFTAPPQPERLLYALKEAAQHTFLYMMQPSHKSTFLGCSPERLYYREGHSISCEAMAGTRPRGHDLEEDKHLSQVLSTNSKEALEHLLVTQGIRKALRSCCSKIRSENSPSVVRLPGLQHLRTHITARLHTNRKDADLLSALHPSPAVGGFPQRAAERYLTDHETHTRGWYAAPVGWMSRDAAEFAVGIRSAHICGKEAFLHVGAGIVEGSSPHAEWSELDLKAALFERAWTQHHA